MRYALIQRKAWECPHCGMETHFMTAGKQPEQCDHRIVIDFIEHPLTLPEFRRVPAFIACAWWALRGYNAAPHDLEVEAKPSRAEA